jgi:hypothetical protein
MAAEWCGIYLATLQVVGLATVFAVGARGRSAAETAGAGGLLGTAMTATVLFWASLAGITPNRGMLAILAVAAVGIVVSARRTTSGAIDERPPARVPRALTGVVWIAAALLVVWSVAVTTIHALGYPLYDWDAFAIWGIKAKVVVDAPVRSAPYFHALPLSFSHLDYPLLVPFATAGTYAAIGAIDDRVGKIAWPFLVVCWTVFLYGAARTRRPRIEAAAIAAIGAGTPVMVQWAGTGNADMQLTVFYGASLYYVAAWIGTRSRADIRLACLFTAACVFTKQEGLALAALNIAAIVVVGRRTIGDVAGSLLLLAALTAPWLVLRMGLPHINEDYVAQFRLATLASNAGRLRITLKYLVATMSRTDLWGPLWYVALAALAIGLRGPNRRALVALTALLAGHFTANVLAYLVASWPIEDLLSASIHRVVLHMMPGAVLILVFGLPCAADAHRA